MERRHSVFWWGVACVCTLTGMINEENKAQKNFVDFWGVGIFVFCFVCFFVFCLVLFCFVINLGKGGMLIAVRIWVRYFQVLGLKPKPLQITNYWGDFLQEKQQNRIFCKRTLGYMYERLKAPKYCLGLPVVGYTRRGSFGARAVSKGVSMLTISLDYINICSLWMIP